MPRSRRLTADEAAERLGLSVGRVTEMARQREIGRKEGGRWTFSEAETRRVAREREDRAKVLKLRKRMENDRRRLNGLPPKRKQRKKRPPLDDDLAPRRRRRPRHRRGRAGCLRSPDGAADPPKQLASLRAWPAEWRRRRRSFALALRMARHWRGCRDDAEPLGCLRRRVERRPWLLSRH